MIRITYKTALEVLEDIKVGDNISDEYHINGQVKRIERENVKHGLIFVFYLYNGNNILVMR